MQPPDGLSLPAGGVISFPDVPGFVPPNQSMVPQFTTGYSFQMSNVMMLGWGNWLRANGYDGAIRPPSFEEIRRYNKPVNPGGNCGPWNSDQVRNIGTAGGYLFAGGVAGLAASGAIATNTGIAVAVVTGFFGGFAIIGAVILIVAAAAVFASANKNNCP